jgi:hypothetical protein
MTRRITPFATLVLAIIFGGFSSGALAQTITGRISGTVTDPSGAAVPGATVKVTNVGTDISRTAMTDPNGFYVVTNLPVGAYAVLVEKQGFKKSNKTGYTLVADGRLTVDFALETGAVSETIEVTASVGETINSTSGEVARVIDQAQVQELALNGRNYMQLTTLIPGAPLLNDDQLGLMTGLGTSQPINGTRGNQNLLTVDGGFNLDSGSNSSQINNVGIDFIREVKIQTSNFSSEYGRNSGSSINVVTRSGENQFHGSAFEFLRNDKLDANNSFNNARDVDRPTLRYNNFGGSFGGPIIKDKFFFFGGLEWKLIRRTSASDLRTIPTSAERNGDFSFRLRGPDGIIGTDDDGALRNPANPASTCSAPTITNGVITKAAVRTGCFPNNAIPANLITADGRAIANVYAAMANEAAFYSDKLTSNNALFQLPNPFNFRQEILRLDYRFNEKHTVYGRYLHDDYNLDDPFGAFITSDLPTIPNNRRRPGYSYQVTHVWMITPALINEVKGNAAWNGQRVLPLGDVWKRDTYGFNFQQLFTGGGRFENSIPTMGVSGFTGWDGAAASLLSPTTDISIGDNLTWVHGSHSLKTGLLVIRNRKDQNGRTQYAGQLSFNPSGNPNTTNNAFADALLGNFRTYTEFSDDPIGFYRFSQIESFVSDNWKVSRKLSLELGLRYQWGLPTYTQANNIANFDPAFYNPAQAVTVKADGTIDTTKGGNRFNGLVRAGAGVPPDELGRVPEGDDPAVLSVPTGALRGLYKPQHLFAPRFSFAYSPFNDSKMAIRGGYGIFYDRPEGNLIFPMTGLPPYSISSQLENGNLASLGAARASAVAPFANINAIDPNLVVPYQMGYSLSVQRELPFGIFGEIAYVGNVARHLIRQPDINAPSFDALSANQLLPSAQRFSTNALRPYKGYSSILMRLSDADSNYNALQVYAAKRKGDLSFTVSYTWSKVLADGSGNTDNISSGEDPFNRSYYYGPASFDRRHILVTTYTYSLPFFSKSRALLHSAFGGWEVSGITRWQTGQYLTPIGSTAIGNRRADYVGGDISQQGPDPLQEWFNKAAFATAPPTRRGTAGLGMIEAPGRYLWDLSLRKIFSVSEKFKLQFQADFFNGFNQFELNNPNTTTSSGAFGTIGGAAPGRNVQLGLKLTF